MGDEFAPVIVSPTEPELIKTLGIVAETPEQYGSDILVGSPHGLIGVQRKVFPADFLSSLMDGRLTTLSIKMRELTMGIMLLEVDPRYPVHWTQDGELIGGRYQFSRRQLEGILWSLQLESGVSHVWTDSQGDTVRYVRNLARWAAKKSHTSLQRRAPMSSMEQSGRGGPSSGDWQRYFLQGVPGVGPDRASKIISHFGGLPLRWSVSEAELGSVPGVGPKTVKALLEFADAAEPTSDG